MPDSSAFPALPSRPRLAFVETADQTQAILDSGSATHVDAMVALEPEAAWALENAGRSYLKLEDAYDPCRICDLADPVVAQQQAWANAIDGWLHDRVPEFRQEAFRPARLYLYWLKLVFDSLAIRVYPLTWAIDRWQPSWICHPGPALADNRFGWDLMFRQSLYPSVLSALARERGIAADVPEAPRGNMATSTPGAHWSTRSSIVDALLRTRRRMRNLLRGGVAASDATEHIVAGDTYDLAPVWREARNSTLRLEPWADFVDRYRTAFASDDVGKTMGGLWRDAVDEAGLLAPARTGAIDLAPAAEDRIRFWWETLIPEQWAAYTTVRADAGRSPAAAVVSVLGDHIERGVFAALRSRGAKTFIYQHGGFVGACECPPWDCNDLWLADCQLTYGAGTSDYFAARARRYPDGRAMSIAVGSSRLDTLRTEMTGSRRSGRKPRVVLVPNLIPRNNRYFDAGTMPDVLESELQVAIVRVAAEFPSCSFIFKAFSYVDQRDTPAIRLARLPGSNCSIEQVARLPALFAQADLIALTFPSTALLEALLTNCRVVVLVDPRFVRMGPEARQALEKRASIASDPKEFVAAVRGLLRDGDFTRLSAPDSTFVRLFATHLDDGRSAARALSAMRALISPRSGSVQTCLASV